MFIKIKQTLQRKLFYYSSILSLNLREVFLVFSFFYDIMKQITQIINLRDGAQTDIYHLKQGMVQAILKQMTHCLIYRAKWFIAYLSKKGIEICKVGENLVYDS